MKNPVVPRVSIVLPTYNEADGISRFLAKLQSVIAGWAERERCATMDLAEVIVVDDNSPDGTARVVRQYQKSWPAVQVVVRTKDRGLGKSILAGVEVSRGEIIVGMDADGNHDASQIPELVTALARHDLVVASRFIGQGGMQQPLRWFATWLFNVGLRLLGFPIWDNFSGFYAIKKPALVSLGLERIYYGYGDYHLRLAYFAAKHGLRILELPTRYLSRLGGQSKSRLFQMAVNYAKEAWRLRFEQN